MSGHSEQDAGKVEKADNCFHREGHSGMQTDVHENRYLQSLATACGVRKSMGVQSFCHGAVKEIICEDNGPAMQGRSRQFRSPFLGSYQP